MKQFLVGFLVASVVWIGVLYAQENRFVEIFTPSSPEAGKKIVSQPAIDTDPAPQKKKKKRGKSRRRNERRVGPVESDLGYELGSGEVGDDLSAGSRSVGMGSGAEEQLSNAEIEGAVDRRFNGIQRCLTLLPPDAPTTGRLVIGMSIANSGSVTKVNLKGPNAMIKGEPGACFRRIVKAMKFRRFGGPDMVVHYPIEFE